MKEAEWRIHFDNNWLWEAKANYLKLTAYLFGSVSEAPAGWAGFALTGLVQRELGSSKFTLGKIPSQYTSWRRQPGIPSPETSPSPGPHNPGEDPPPVLFREALVWGRCRKAGGGGLAVGLPIGGKDSGSNPHSVTKPERPWTSPSLSFFTCRMGIIVLAPSHIMGCVSKNWVQSHPSGHSMGKESERQDLEKKKSWGKWRMQVTTAWILHYTLDKASARASYLVI